MATIIEIDDLNRPELDVYARLTEAQLRNRLEPEKGILIAESTKVITTALDAGLTPRSMLMERKHIDGQARQIIRRCGDIPVYTADREVLEQLTGYTLTRGILCAMSRPRPRSLAEICQGASRLVLLEGIVDSTNLGAIFRSAAALNMDGVILSPSCCDPFYRRAARVSMGTVFQIPFARMEEGWPHPGMDTLHAMGFKTAAMALCDDSVSLDDPRLLAEEKLVVIMGTEGDGLERQTIERCDYTVKIPMGHGVDSLNVAAASAVAFWQLGHR